MKKRLTELESKFKYDSNKSTYMNNPAEKARSLQASTMEDPN